MTAATATHRAGPKPHRTYRIGDRVTDHVTMPGGPHRLIGDVTDSSSRLFTVTWEGGYGHARYTHGHEPDHLRHVTPADERDHLTRDARHGAAGELLRMATRHTGWPPAVLHALRLRAAELTGDTR